MNTIALERWEPKPDGPRYMQYAGPRTAVEVFNELKERLDGMGMLPDEYLLLDMDWKNGKEIPKGADVFCTTDYGGNEGVYLDVYLKWYEGGKPITKSFVTGKTLGRSGADLDRMFLISSAITKAFHGDGGTYARYTKLGGAQEPESMILCLNPEEQRTFINALVRQREELLGNVDQTEKLLRRMTGSITAYMDEVGQRPLHVNTFDRVMLAVRDGETKAFAELLPAVADRKNELLIAAAGRPGMAGRKMLVEVLAVGKEFSGDVYLTACKQAVDTTETQRIQFLLEQAEASVEGLEPSFYGEVIQYAYNDHPHIAGTLIRESTPEQIAAAPPELLHLAVTHNDTQSQFLLLDQGMDFEQYKEWRERQYCGGDFNTMQALEEYWEQIQSQQQQGPRLGGMEL